MTVLSLKTNKEESDLGYMLWLRLMDGYKYIILPKFLNTVMEHTILQTRINHCRVVNFIMINVVQYVLWFFFFQNQTSQKFGHYTLPAIDNSKRSGAHGFWRNIWFRQRDYKVWELLWVVHMYDSIVNNEGLPTSVSLFASLLC